MMKLSLPLLTGAALLAFTSLTAAENTAPPPKTPVQKAPEKVKISASAAADRANAVYQTGEKIVFKVNAAPADAVQSISANLHADGHKQKKVTLDADQTLTVTADQPGFVLFRGEVTFKDGRKKKFDAGAAIEPEKIRPTQTVPPDFDEFWNRAKAELAGVPMKATLTPVDLSAAKNLSRYAGKVDLYDVQITCAGPRPVSAYMAIPRNAAPGSLPIVMNYHGAGVRSSTASEACRFASMGAIAFDVNAHGIANGRDAEFYKALDKGELKNYARREWRNPEKNYFRHMFLRVLRAQEYAKSLPQWDKKTLIVTGHSQGGAQTFAAAALDQDVTAMAALAPAISDITGEKAGRRSCWPWTAWFVDGKWKDPVIARNSGYFDNSSFAARITKPACLVTCGFVDTTCPPSSVYASYNAIAAPDKAMIHDVKSGHGLARQGSWAERDRFVRGQIEKAAR